MLNYQRVTNPFFVRPPVPMAPQKSLRVAALRVQCANGKMEAPWWRDFLTVFEEKGAPPLISIQHVLLADFDA